MAIKTHQVTGAEEVKTLVRFPDGYPNIITGTLSIDGNSLISAHTNGMVVKSDIGSGKSAILYQGSPTIRTISISPNNEVAVGTESGLLIVFPLERPSVRQVIQEETFNVYSRVWRTIWPSNNTLLYSSTYGVLNLAKRNEKDEWTRGTLRGHGNSVFGLGSTTDGSFVASGDYRGNLIVWKRTGDGGYGPLAELKVQDAIEDVSWRDDGAFAGINASGHVYFFEPGVGGTPREWQLVLETDTATGAGKCVHLTADNKTLFAGTVSELIQVDLDSQQIQQTEMPLVRRIFSLRERIFVLTASGLLAFERKDIQVPVNLVKYQFAKVSLVGHTGTGKTTLSSLIVKGIADDIKSTFGKRIWEWRLEPAAGSLERRIILHDHGGQETVLTTFLPFVGDSDLILLFFKQTDVSTFRRAVATMEQLSTLVSSRTKMLFVETHIDHGVNEIDEGIIRKLVDERKVRAWAKVCPPTGQGAKELKEQLVSEISWQNARTMIQSDYVEDVTRTISQLTEERARVVSFQDFKKRYEQFSGRSISSSHLRFLLSSYTSQGLIEYYPQILDAIIFNDEDYNRLKTSIPILVDKKHGIVSMRDLRESFSNHEYLPIIDQIYLKYGIAIKNHDLRIFPDRLRPQSSDIPEGLKKLLAEPVFTVEQSFQFRQFAIGRLIEALSELDLHCVDASQRDGIFAWEKNACIYYALQESGDAFSGHLVKISYRIGGEKPSSCLRLSDEFAAIVERLYGPHVNTSTSTPSKKKV